MKKNIGSVIYFTEEHSFDFEPNLSADFSYLIGYLNLTFESERKVARQVWGLNPKNTWISKELVPPNSFQGELLAQNHLESGESERIVDVGVWKTYFDNENGWVCIGDYNHTSNDQSVEFAENTIAVINEKKLKALWLKPNFV